MSTTRSTTADDLMTAINALGLHAQWAWTGGNCRAVLVQNAQLVADPHVLITHEWDPFTDDDLVEDLGGQTLALYVAGATFVVLFLAMLGYILWDARGQIAGLFAGLWGMILGFPVLRLRGDSDAHIVRGLVALMVALFHFTVRGHYVASSFGAHAFLFVDFFFVLSGFIMTYLHLRAPGRQDAGRFLRSRVARIYPPYIVASFGFLALRSLRGLPLSLPSTTGVPAPMPGGRHHPVPGRPLPG